MKEPSEHLPVVGIDLGATNMLLGIVDGDDRIITRRHTKTEGEKGISHVLEKLISEVQGVCDDAGLGSEDRGGIGIAVAGAVDVASGVVLDAHNLKWKNVPLRRKLEDAFGKPVYVDNDANASVWGESRVGAGRGGGDLFGVWVGTGIGGGLVLNDKLYHGAFSTAGEFGLTIITPDGKSNFRTVEDHAGRTGMRRVIAREMQNHPESIIFQLTRGDAARIGTNELAEAFHGNDELTCRIITRGADLLGIAIANFVTFLAVDTVIIGGGITEALGERYLDLIRKAFERDVFPARCRACRIVATELQADAGLLGAALLARDASA